MVWLFAIAQLVSCSHSKDQIYPEQELIYQRLKFREGYEGKLTYSVCEEKSDGVCTKEKIKSYDLADPKARQTLNALGFICRVGERRGKVCQDSAGICSIAYTSSCSFPWCKKTEIVAERWDAVADFIFLMGAGTRCYQASQYPFES